MRFSDRESGLYPTRAYDTGADTGLRTDPAATFASRCRLLLTLRGNASHEAFRIDDVAVVIPFADHFRLVAAQSLKT